jgi:hypothetical protein
MPSGIGGNSLFFIFQKMLNLGKYHFAFRRSETGFT